MSRPISFARVGSRAAQIGVAPETLFLALTDDGRDEVWRGLGAEHDEHNERLRTADPLDPSLRPFTGVDGEKRAAKFARPVKRPRPRLAAVPDEDVLLSVTPREYMEVLIAEEVPASGMVKCPLHEDRTPSMKVYDDVSRGWYCFSCAAGGSIYDLGGALYGLGTRGSDFIELRRRLASALLGREAA